MSISRTIQKIMQVIDREGAPPMTKEDWKELLEGLIMECESRHEAVREELRDGN